MATCRWQIGCLKVCVWGRSGKRASGRWMKKQVIRYWRRAAKRDPENAPKKRPINGYD